MDISNLTAASSAGGTAIVVKAPADASYGNVNAAALTTAAAPAQSAKAVSRALDDINTQLAKDNHSHNLNFQVDKDIGMTVVRVVDASTQEVITQFPAEVVVRIAHALSQYKGTLLAETA